MRDIEIFNKLSYFLDNFKAPLTFKIYDYENDRATPINKHLFTEEKIIIKAITTHVHAYNGLAPDLNQTELKKLLEYNLEQILSKNVRIN